MYLYFRSAYTQCQAACLRRGFFRQTNRCPAVWNQSLRLFLLRRSRLPRRRLPQFPLPIEVRLLCDSVPLAVRPDALPAGCPLLHNLCPAGQPILRCYLPSVPALAPICLISVEKVWLAFLSPFVLDWNYCTTLPTGAQSPWRVYRLQTSPQTVLTPLGVHGSPLLLRNRNSLLVDLLVAFLA